MAPAPLLMTVDDYFHTPESLAPSELIYGVMRVAEASSPRHQSAVGQLFLALVQHTRERRLGQVWLSPLDVVLDEERALVVQPDLLFISTARAFIVRDRVRGAPDLVIEVLSPNARIGQTSERVAWFAEYDVRECWLVHQDRRDVTVVTCGGGRVRHREVYGWRDRMQSAVLPDWSLSLSDVLLSE